PGRRGKALPVIVPFFRVCPTWFPPDVSAPDGAAPPRSRRCKGRREETNQRENLFPSETEYFRRGRAWSKRALRSIAGRPHWAIRSPLWLFRRHWRLFRSAPPASR